MVSPEDIAYIRSLFPEINDIQNKELAEKVVEIWAETWHESQWSRIEDAPKNVEVSERRLVAHTRAVTNNAMGIASSMRQFHGIELDFDLVIAAGLLHDVSKLIELRPVDGGVADSPAGVILQHGVYGAHKVLQKGLPLPLAHVAVGHAFSPRANPTKTPICMEAALIHYSDLVDSDALKYARANR